MDFANLIQTIAIYAIPVVFAITVHEAAHGYVANVPQTERALEGIRLSATVYSAIPFALGLVCLALYPISKELNLRIGDELAERRKKFATE